MTESEKQELIDKVRRKVDRLTAAKVNQAEIILVEVVEIIKNFQIDEEKNRKEEAVAWLESQSKH